MMMRSSVARMAAAFGAAGLLVMLPLAAHSQGVGSAAAVRPSSTGTPPGGSTRTLQAGTKIVTDERIQTSGSGSLQVMFNDRSTLTVGPNSDMVIDTFVYNPGAGTGQFGVNLAKGTLRFVGGQISHTAGAKITAPSATLGIRGGIGTAEVLSNGNTTFGCQGGNCVVTFNDGRTVEMRVNEVVTIIGEQVTSLGASSFNLNEISKGGKTTDTEGNGKTSNSNDNLGLTISEEIKQLLNNQANAPVPPPPDIPDIPGFPQGPGAIQ